jgi:hypothetical protein
VEHLKWGNSMSNIFGGKNQRSLYIPLSDIELEVIQRLLDTKDLRVICHGWQTFESPKVVHGDKNIHIPLKLVFKHPSVPTPVYFFDLELQTGSGMTLFRKKMSTLYGGEPISVMEGLEIDMVWDISIRNLDPNLVRAVKPSAIGLTSKLQDTTTGLMTSTGNFKNRELVATAQKIFSREELLKKGGIK